ncbi:MAG: hypothetical protein M5U23_11955 [Acidimicrobiia bacterium]|nr:hypothetical protein [Acidimicrobiia bacterium]
MWGSNTKVWASLIAVFGLVFMALGLATASAQSTSGGYDPTITAQSDACETVTIYYNLVERILTTTTTEEQTGPSIRYGIQSPLGGEVLAGIPFTAQGIVDSDVRDTAGVGSAQIVFTGVAPGSGIPWSGSMSWLAGPDYPSGEYSNEGTVEVEPCPATTTTQPTVTTTQPGDTTTSTIGQVETDLSDGTGPGVGLTAALAAIGVSLLGGAALIAARRES